MPRPVAVTIAALYRRTQERILTVSGDLSTSEFAQRWEHANSIAFDVWHCARWADHLQSLLPLMLPELERLGSRPQIWEREKLAAAWGFDPAELGDSETGMGIDEAIADRLAMPPKEAVVQYAQCAFESAWEATAQLHDVELPMDAMVNGKPSGTVAGWVIGYYEHDNRHLGMIELRRGLLGRRGTATR